MFFIFLMTIDDPEERQQIEDLYNKHRYHCLHIARRYAHSEEDAEDMVQDVFVRVIKHKDEYLYLDEEEFKALLVTITKNLGIDIKRREKRHAIIEQEYGFQINTRAMPTETVVLIQEDYKRVMEEIDKLSEADQLIMYYRSLSIPVQTIAEMMDMPFKTVETKLYRIRKKLKEKLAEDDFFD